MTVHKYHIDNNIEKSKGPWKKGKQSKQEVSKKARKIIAQYTEDAENLGTEYGKHFDDYIPDIAQEIINDLEQEGIDFEDAYEFVNDYVIDDLYDIAEQAYNEQVKMEEEMDRQYREDYIKHGRAE